MVTFVKGDIFKSPAQVLTNAVNCVGVMGKGIALEFKNRYPKMFDDYKTKCDREQLKLGEPYLWEDESTQILNFPTKKHWKDGSLLNDVEDGLKYLATSYERMGIQSIAMPALGCGLGGLKWSDVRALIQKYLDPISDLDVYVYEPKAAAFKSNFDTSDSENVSNDERISARSPEL